MDIHYLDDYFLAGPPNYSICQDHLQCFLKLCKLRGFPVAMDKVEGPVTTLIFLWFGTRFGLEGNKATPGGNFDRINTLAP